ncbi:hypothetical protein [Formosa algae]|uniref:Uncharacterized protein n=1 Tax=Formosa algae TaxID=225843 RepID=A0A9X0YLG7_9FLAO|nr:hypothetical protein [Formosa algae]MBP1840776.1 hypothetical protein [Formosa algae]MDQ0336327.1 hypothetical protein [Formosa algae]OEI79291.1 hypothetical protein AST99_15240 [Formosa algae]
MEQIGIILFILTSFLGIKEGQIAAEKTTVTIDVQNKKIDIIQEHLFTVIESEKDVTLILDQWDKMYNSIGKNTTWSEQLDDFSDKRLTVFSKQNILQSHIILNYSEEADLQVFGIWYNSENNQFSIHDTPQNNIKTTEGKLNGMYWTFSGDTSFSFSLEPFLQMPTKYQDNKRYISDLLLQATKE